MPRKTALRLTTPARLASNVSIGCVSCPSPLALVWCPLSPLHFAARDFWRRRGVNDEHIRERSVRNEQRSLRQKELPPGGLRQIWPVALLLLGHSPIEGMLRFDWAHRMRRRA